MKEGFWFIFHSTGRKGICGGTQLTPAAKCMCIHNSNITQNGIHEFLALCSVNGRFSSGFSELGEEEW
jgi:hypothetical protein